MAPKRTFQLRSGTAGATSHLNSAHNFVSFDSSINKLVKMGRLHSKGKGISASAIPYSRSVPTWFKSTPDNVVEQICKLARKGATPSQIGVVLRDSHGVAQVKVVTGMSSRGEDRFRQTNTDR